MTVESTVNKSGPYAGAGSAGPFTVGFRFLDQTHLRVIKTGTDGLNNDLVLTTDYTVAGVGDPTGSVTLTAVLAVGEQLTIVRNVPATQEADYVQNDAFPAQSHEDALDKLTMLVQQLQERVNAALTLPETVTDADTQLPVPQSNYLIGWNSTADGLANIDPGTLAAIVAYGTMSAQLLNGDGTTGPFVLTSDPISVNNAQVHISGVRQRPTIDYTVTGTQLSFTSATPVGTNNILVVWGSSLPMGEVSDASVTTPKIVDGAITEPKLDSALATKINRDNPARRTVITASGTHNFLSGVRKALVQVLGGGGAGGGASANGATTGASAGGGGAGAYAEKIITLGSITSATITVGAAGTGSAGTTGGTGGQSVYADGTNTLTCPGGNGGTMTLGATYITSTAGGAKTSAPTGGDLNIEGGAGAAGFAAGEAPMGIARCCAAGGNGAGTKFGEGGQGGVIVSATSAQSAVGGAGTGYGSGGGGSSRARDSGTNAGGNGAPGVVIITEYY